MQVAPWSIATGIVLVLGLVSPSQATFSIAACERSTGRCGVAVATHNLAVGNSVPFARAHAGAGVSQFETNPNHGPQLLDALTRSLKADQALAKILELDVTFKDGNDTTQRQIGVVAIDGGSAAYTGTAANGYAGHRTSDGVSVQGNGLASAKVLDAMLASFENSAGMTLSERLLSALEQGYAAGGQTIGVMSAALRVATPEGWPVDTDLRVDFDSSAIVKLRQAFDASLARQYLFQARQLLARDQKSASDGLVLRALEKAPAWDRIWLGAAYIAEQTNDTQALKQRFCRFHELNPVWAQSLQDQFSAVECHE